MQRDARRQLADVAKVGRDVREVLHRIRVIALAQERALHPIPIPRKPVERVAALPHRSSQVRKAPILIRAVPGVVPADVVEELVAARELDLPQPLVRLDARGELDLVAVGVEAAAVARVRPDDAAPPAERAHVLRKAGKRTLDELGPRCDVDEEMRTPPAAAKGIEIVAGEALGERERATAYRSKHDESIGEQNCVLPVARAEAPGRVNLIGEHTDYNDGLVLPTAIPQRTYVEVAPRTDDRVALASEGYPRAAYRLGAERRTGDWADHIRGVTWALADSGMDVGGFDARIRSDVPPGAGLSSSAALEVALVRALRDVFALALDDVALALVAHRAECDFVGARVGTMDHLAASLAHDREALLIDTRSLAIERVPLPADCALVVIDSGIAHANVSGDYQTRRDECDAAARALGIAALRDATDAQVVTLGQSDPTLARRARHVVTENERVRAFVRALRQGDLPGCGTLLDASHASLRDDFDVSLAEIDELVRLLRDEPSVYGARLVGGGFGGSVLAIARPADAAPTARRAAQRYTASTGRTARVILPA